MRASRRTVVSSSRMKAFLSFQDLFQSSFKSSWKNIRGSWSASSSIATTNTGSSNYPLASVPMSSPNVNISIKNPGVGTGAALWVTDSGDWWGLVSSQALSSGTGACGSYNAYNPCSGSNPYNPCGATNGYSGGNCAGTGGNCNSTAGNCIGAGGNCISDPGGNCVSSGGNCNTGGGGGGNCNTSAASGGNCNVAGGNCNTFGGNCNTSGGNCNTGGGNCKAFGNCFVYGSYYIACCSGGYNPYNPCVNTNPINWCVNINPYNPCVTVNAIDYCKSINPYVPANNCVNINPYVPYNPCVNVNPINYCSSINPSNPCVALNTYNPCASTNPGNPCSGTNPYNPCGATNPITGGNCAGTGGNCNASGGTCISYNNTYPRYLQFIRFINNAATSIYTITLDSVTQFVQMKGLNVNISNAVKGGTTATITAKAFSDTAMITQIGQDLIYNATNVKIIANYGIVASPSSYNESNSVGEITIQ
jgi:hypothetical protein